MMRFLPTILATVFTILQLHKSTAASVTFFTDKAAWEKAVGSTNFIVETFNDLPSGFTPSDGGSKILPNNSKMDFDTEGIEYISTVSESKPGDARIINKNRSGLVFQSPVDGSDYLFVAFFNLDNGDFRDWQMKSTTSFPIAAFSMDYIHFDGASENVLQMITDDASEDFIMPSGRDAEFLGAIFDPPTFQITLASNSNKILRGNLDNLQFHFDSCPDDDAKTEPGICGCGVADVDSDNDGTLDCNDGCEDDPLKLEPGICGCGVEDIDSDNDGTLDCNDGCADDPLKLEPGICGCGVADVDLDSDNDGTPDCIDGCEDDPLKTEPGICGCGVADIDSDNDGIPDCNEGELDEEEQDEEDECGVLFRRNCK